MTILDLLLEAGAVVTADFAARPVNDFEERSWRDPVSVTINITGPHGDAARTYASLPPGKYRLVAFLLPKGELERPVQWSNRLPVPP